MCRRVANNETATMFATALGSLTAQIMNDIVSALACFSVFASMLSIHNVAARYLFSLGQDGVIPKMFGKSTRKASFTLCSGSFGRCILGGNAHNIRGKRQAFGLSVSALQRPAACSSHCW